MDKGKVTFLIRRLKALFRNEKCTLEEIRMILLTVAKDLEDEAKVEANINKDTGLT